MPEPFDPEAWERRLTYAISLYRVALDGHALTGGHGDAVDGARRDVVGVLDAAMAAGVTEAEQDAALERINEARR